MRIQQIDALRGFALFGILMVNIFVFHAPYPHYSTFYGEFEGANAAALENMIFFCGGKFMFIYAFLFGYSFWMQYERKKSDFRGYWNRRMLVLAGFGVLHILLLSFGDILLPYALLGFSLPFFAKFSNAKLFLWVLLISLIPVYEFVLRGFIDFSSIFMQPVASLEQYIEINRNGSWREIFELRLKDYFSFKNEKLIIYIPKEISLFLLGMIAARKQLATQLSVKRGVLFCIFAVLVIGSMYFFRAQIIGFFDFQASIIQSILLGLIIHITEFVHGALYIVLFFLLWTIRPIQKLQYWLTFPGKLSLTNYIAQSLICAILFSELDYYGQLTPIQLICCVLAIYLGQLIFSVIWLRYYQYGPLESIWRKLAKKKAMGAL
ncbi:MAG: DUF418 domain-containing protein [Bacteroidota bacterium]